MRQNRPRFKILTLQIGDLSPHTKSAPIITLSFESYYPSRPLRFTQDFACAEDASIHRKRR